MSIELGKNNANDEINLFIELLKSKTINENKRKLAETSLILKRIIESNDLKYQLDTYESKDNKNQEIKLTVKKSKKKSKLIDVPEIRKIYRRNNYGID